jgi:hypothetical protein
MSDEAIINHSMGGRGAFLFYDDLSFGVRGVAHDDFPLTGRLTAEEGIALRDVLLRLFSLEAPKPKVAYEVATSQGQACVYELKTEPETRRRKVAEFVLYGDAEFFAQSMRTRKLD